LIPSHPPAGPSHRPAGLSASSSPARSSPYPRPPRKSTSPRSRSPRRLRRANPPPPASLLAVLSEACLIHLLSLLSRDRPPHGCEFRQKQIRVPCPSTASRDRDRRTAPAPCSRPDHRRAGQLPTRASNRRQGGPTTHLTPQITQSVRGEIRGLQEGEKMATSGEILGRRWGEHDGH
jgi:hypothetical protein